MQSKNQIHNCVYKLLYIVFKNKYKCWKFIYVDFFRWHMIISLSHIKIDYEPEEAVYN